MSDKKNHQSIIMCLIDGFGLSSNWKGNAILSAQPQSFFNIWSSYPHYLLSSPNDVFNNKPSYVNPEYYLTSLFLGRETLSQSQYLDDKVKEGLLEDSIVLNQALDQAVDRNSALHLIGNIPQNKVSFSELKHLVALIKLAKKKNIYRVYIHLILDSSGGGFDDILDGLNLLEDEIEKAGVGEIASICGLNFIREENAKKLFNDFKKAYRAIVEGSGNTFLSAEQAINRLKRSINSPSDFLPSVILFRNNPIGRISDFDSIIFFNHNNSLLTKLVLALSSSNLEGGRFSTPKFLFLATFFDCILPKPEQLRTIFNMKNETSLPWILDQSSIRQIYITDSSRMLNIKTILSGLENTSEFLSEDYVPVLSQGQSSTNDKAVISEISSRAISAIQSNRYDFIFINFSSIDEAAKSNLFDRTQKAVKEIDNILPVLLKNTLDLNGVFLLTSLYGNAEKMVHRNLNEKLNNKTFSPTPLIIASNENYKQPKDTSIESLVLYDMITKKYKTLDIAPTILHLFNLPVPKEFSGQNLI